jgi:DNA-binding LacI/PurR family transcriptional regulator
MHVLNWSPNQIASIVSRPGLNIADTVGLALPHNVFQPRLGSLYTSVIAGITNELKGNGKTLLVTTSQDARCQTQTHRDWWNSGLTCGSILLGLEDPELTEACAAMLGDAGSPVVLIGPLGNGTSINRAWTDDDQAADNTVRYLAALGHRRLAHITVHAAKRGLETRARRGDCRSSCLSSGLGLIRPLPWPCQAPAHWPRRVLRRQGFPRSLKALVTAEWNGRSVCHQGTVSPRWK